MPITCSHVQRGGAEKRAARDGRIWAGAEELDNVVLPHITLFIYLSSDVQ